MIGTGVNSCACFNAKVCAFQCKNFIFWKVCAMNDRLRSSRAVAHLDLVQNQLLHLVAAGSAVLLGIKAVGMLSQVGFHASAEGVSQLGGEVHLADAQGGCLLHVLIGDAGGAVKDDGDGDALSGLFQVIEFLLRKALVVAEGIAAA